uniref:Uncharacterized protein n=1 Tax=Arundo donax TaxID=35708 RepID=A0A0A9C8K3_ARUDO
MVYCGTRMLQKEESFKELTFKMNSLLLVGGYQAYFPKGIIVF